MGKALSMDLREWAMARLAAGESVRKIASALDVAPSSVVKWSQRLRTTGSCAPAGTGGHPPRKIVDVHEAWLLERIKTPFTLRGLVVELAELGLKPTDNDPGSRRGFRIVPDGDSTWRTEGCSPRQRRSSFVRTTRRMT